jgi:AraC-like DNA-binding protein
MPRPPTAATPRHGGRVALAYAQPLLELAQEHGVDLQTLAVAAGMPAHALSPPPDSLAAGDYVRLLDAAAELTRHPHFGLQVGERVKLGTYSVYGLILLSCHDFGQVFQQTLRYEGLAHDLGRSSLDVVGSTAEYRWNSHFPQASRHLAESVFAGVQVFGTWLAGRPLPAARVAFAHTAPPDCHEHHRIFGTDVLFGAPAHCARFDAALLSLPVPNADVGLYPVLRQHAETLLQQKQRQQGNADIVTQVRHRIAHHLAQDDARLATVAHDLGLTPRTLQRKLQDAGARFQQVLDQTRQELAQEYLQQHSLGLVDIAFLLGYQDQSAFSHAFKEWTGMSPGSYRERCGKA